jgi:hypothetical protein
MITELHPIYKKWKIIHYNKGGSPCYFAVYNPDNNTWVGSCGISSTVDTKYYYTWDTNSHFGAASRTLMEGLNKIAEHYIKNTNTIL